MSDLVWIVVTGFICSVASIVSAIVTLNAKNDVLKIKDEIKEKIERTTHER